MQHLAEGCFLACLGDTPVGRPSSRQLRFRTNPAKSCQSHRGSCPVSWVLLVVEAATARVVAGGYVAGVAGTRGLVQIPCAGAAAQLSGEELFADEASGPASGRDGEHSGPDRGGPLVEDVQFIQASLDGDELTVHVCLVGGKNQP